MTSRGSYAKMARMRVHHLNCATLAPPVRRLINGTGGWLEPARLVCHCLLVETEAGLVLVDTGFGLADVADPRGRLGLQFLAMVRPRLDEQETAVRQIERLGFRREDVRHVVVTHLDVDHAGALSDFPAATVHVYEEEYAAATAPATIIERSRYRPIQWAHGPTWARHRVRGERWRGFECVQALGEGVPPELLMVPLHGHTRGHCGVAVDTGDGWLLHAGDSYFHYGEVHAPARRCPAALDLMQRVEQHDAAARTANQSRLRDLAAGATDVQVFSAHCPLELARYE